MNRNPAAAQTPYAEFGYSVAEAPASERTDFIRKTYTHLAVATYTFGALLWVYVQSGFAKSLTEWMVQYGMLGMALMFGLFMVTSFIAGRWAQNDASPAIQYAGLFGYVFAESLFITPMIYYAQDKSLELVGGHQMGVIGAAAVTTLILFTGLTAIVWLSGKDFSFLGVGLQMLGLGALALIVVSFVFGMNLGVWFSAGMIILAAGYILYETSNVMHHYRPGQHVAAALALFASVALMFWYVLRILMAFASDD